VKIRVLSICAAEASTENWSFEKSWAYHIPNTKDLSVETTEDTEYDFFGIV